MEEGIVVEEENARIRYVSAQLFWPPEAGVLVLPCCRAAAIQAMHEYLTGHDRLASILVRSI